MEGQSSHSETMWFEFMMSLGPSCVTKRLRKSDIAFWDMIECLCHYTLMRVCGSLSILDAIRGDEFGTDIRDKRFVGPETLDHADFKIMYAFVDQVTSRSERAVPNRLLTWFVDECTGTDQKYETPTVLFMEHLIHEIKTDWGQALDMPEDKTESIKDISKSEIKSTKDLESEIKSTKDVPKNEIKNTEDSDWVTGDDDKEEPSIKWADTVARIAQKLTSCPVRVQTDDQDEGCIIRGDCYSSMLVIQSKSRGPALQRLWSPPSYLASTQLSAFHFPCLTQLWRLHDPSVGAQCGCGMSAKHTLTEETNTLLLQNVARLPHLQELARLVLSWQYPVHSGIARLTKQDMHSISCAFHQELASHRPNTLLAPILDVMTEEPDLSVQDRNRKLRALTDTLIEKVKGYKFNRQWSYDPLPDKCRERRADDRRSWLVSGIVFGMMLVLFTWFAWSKRMVIVSISNHPPSPSDDKSESPFQNDPLPVGSLVLLDRLSALEHLVKTINQSD